MFTKSGIREANHQFNEEEIRVLKDDWKNYIANTSKFNQDSSGKGIVYTAGNVTYISCVIVSIKLLRSLGCRLPIEVWYLGNEVSKSVIDAFHGLNVEFRDFLDIDPDISPGYVLKPLAIINSRFLEVLFLDADNNCILNPEYLFTLKEYEDFGCIFWPDFWKTSPDNAIWKIIEKDYFDENEQESGQILIHKQKCWKELQLCLYFNMLSAYYYKILLGDKDTFKFAWLALDKKYYMVHHHVGSLGFKEDKRFYGTTMVQFDTFGKPLFLHRNLIKWGVTKADEQCWEYIKTFTVNANNKEFIVCDSPRGDMSIDIRGDIQEQDFVQIYGNLETKCLNILNEWRRSDHYLKFLQYSHFIENRFSTRITFTKMNEPI
ncbi:hypothetical protein KHS38_21240 [Mucilaginibacter sp. Bleaf8]|uniref:hypothetical protein n=1 Tax=Mucilaginibacter sp. Bleaf8 TaxID=2834430 RepID=UPI001BCC2A76|nr:hypothetical protein [Mucilaginibacter sp. Bleaf8]MBS7566944.1 hypothetical protein [Mucilaginibacter sp. Bleaf8]